MIAAMFLPALPALGQAIIDNIFDNEQIGRFVRLGLNVVVQGVSADEDLKQLNAEIEAMVAEGRGPTDEEWGKYDTMIDDALRRARAAVGDGSPT